MSQFQIRKAERKNLLARIGISGPSGAGKTMSSILIARGLVGPDGAVVVLDTEQASSEMYSDRAGGFQVVPFEPPYDPKRYMLALDYIEKEYSSFEPAKLAIVVDQISNAWAGKGGVLEFVDKAKSASGSRAGFSAWKDATPMQQDFVERLLRVKGQLIVTMRSKVEWVVERDERGKQTPRKIGLSPVQREGIEYEFQIMLDLSNESNMASVSKDRTGLLYGTNFKPEISTGERIREFLASGKLIEEIKKPAAAKPATTAAPDAGKQSADGDPSGAGAPREPGSDDDVPFDVPAEDNRPTITAQERSKLVEAAKAAGLKPVNLKAILQKVGGVSESGKLKQAFLPAVLAAIQPGNGDGAGA